MRSCAVDGKRSDPTLGSLLASHSGPLGSVQSLCSLVLIICTSPSRIVGKGASTNSEINKIQSQLSPYLNAFFRKAISLIEAMTSYSHTGPCANPKCNFGCQGFVLDPNAGSGPQNMVSRCFCGCLAMQHKSLSNSKVGLVLPGVLTWVSYSSLCSVPGNNRAPWPVQSRGDPPAISCQLKWRESFLCYC